MDLKEELRPILTRMRTMMIPGAGTVARQSGEHMMALGSDNMLSLIQKAEVIDSCRTLRSFSNQE